jgi:hypothetical protein
MNLSLLAAINFFKKKNRFRITERLAEKSARNIVQPVNSAKRTTDYILTNMQIDPEGKDDFLSRMQKNADELHHASKAAKGGQTHWHKNKFVQEYRMHEGVAFNPQIEIYYQKLGLGQSARKTTIGETPQPGT